VAQQATGDKVSLLNDASRDKIIRKVTWIGFFANLVLAAIKFAAGFFGKSQAVMADAIHTLTDLTTDIAVIAGSHYWSRPPDEDHPYGHKRLEALITVFIAIVLAAAGIKNFKSMLNYSAANTPLRRNVTIEEVGNTAAFLCSDLASGITGEITYVDGGYNITGMASMPSSEEADQ